MRVKQVKGEGLEWQGAKEQPETGGYVNAEEIQRKPWGEKGSRGLHCKSNEVTA